MFNATCFSYDGVDSAEYGLLIADFDSSNIITTNGFTAKLTMEKGAKSKRFYHSGITYTETPPCEFTLISESPLSAVRRREVISWLLGRKNFKKLEIHQEEYADLYFMCVFTKIDLIYINGNCHGFKIKGQFDSQYCYGAPKTTIIKGDGSEKTVDMNINIDIGDEFVFPKIIANCDFNIINETDSGKETFCSGLNEGEVITIDGETRMISSTFGGNCFLKFGTTSNEYFTPSNWLRLKKGRNKIKITCNGEVQIICPTYYLIGT